MKCSYVLSVCLSSRFMACSLDVLYVGTTTRLILLSHLLSYFITTI